MNKAVLVTGANGAIKSVPLNSLPAAAWTSLTGGVDSGEIDTLYEVIPWLYRGTNAICNAVAGMPHALHRGNEDGPEVDAATLKFQINLGELLDNWARMMVLRGAAYAMLERNTYRVLKVRTLHPATMQPRYDRETGLIGFKRQLGGVQISLDMNEVAYVWQPNHAREIGPGPAPARAALRAAGVLNSMDVFASAYFENGAINPTVIEMSEDAQEADVERVRSWSQRVLGGIKNAFRMTAVAGSVKAHTLGSSMRDLVVPELTNSKREDVATALGVPQTLMFSNAANYATAQQDDLHFYDKTVRPLDKRIVDALNEQIFAPMGLKLVTHTERMEMYQRQESAKAYSVAQLYLTGVVTREEARTNMNLPAQAQGTFYERRAQQQNTSVPQPQQMPRPPEVRDEMDEMMKWRRLAIKRLKEGKPGKMAAFEAEDVPPTLAASIRGALAKATTVERVNAVFEDAARWTAYP